MQPPPETTRDLLHARHAGAAEALRAQRETLARAFARRRRPSLLAWLLLPLQHPAVTALAACWAAIAALWLTTPPAAPPPAAALRAYQAREDSAEPLRALADHRALLRIWQDAPAPAPSRRTPAVTPPADDAPESEAHREGGTTATEAPPRWIS